MSREPSGEQTSTVLSQGTSFPAAHLALQIQAGLDDMTSSNCQLFLHESMASVPGQGSFPRKPAIHSYSVTLGPLAVASECFGGIGNTLSSTLVSRTLSIL